MLEVSSKGSELVSLARSGESFEPRGGQEVRDAEVAVGTPGTIEAHRVPTRFTTRSKLEFYHFMGLILKYH